MIDLTPLMNALSRIRKDVDIAKIVRNASRDYSQGAYKATPLAKISKSSFYRTPEGKYIHERMLVGRKKKSIKQLRKVRIYKGWSRATWIGVFRSLGMSMARYNASIPPAVEQKSFAIKQESPVNARTTIKNDVAIDRFGRGVSAIPNISREGLNLAENRLLKALKTGIAGKWHQ